MSGKTHVILITGFLGSGKTTFLNRIIKKFPPNQKLMILMNEFGEIGLDGTLLESDDLDILEISKGSIFCVCVKTDFIRGLNEIAQKIQPDVLIVESTGVANPSDLKKDLTLSIFQGRFDLTHQICMIDADSFEDAYQSFVSVEKQIASSTFFIINKVDLAGPDTLARIKKIIHGHHTTPEILETTFAEVPLERFIPAASNRSNSDLNPAKVIDDQQLDQAIESMLATSDPNTTPPDRLLSAVFSWAGSHINDFRNILPDLPKGLIRAKGFLQEKETVYLFNLVMGQRNLEIYTSKKDLRALLNRLVFIGPPEVIESLHVLSRKYPDLIQDSVFDPMEKQPVQAADRQG